MQNKKEIFVDMNSSDSIQKAEFTKSIYLKQGYKVSNIIGTKIILTK